MFCHFCSPPNYHYTRLKLEVKLLAKKSYISIDFYSLLA
nr:MAG TPA: hypothetical protein [Bacteriophage sp.]